MNHKYISLGLIISSLSWAATPIDGWYSSVFGGYAYLPNNLNKTIQGRTWTDANYSSGYDLGGSLGYKSNPMRYEGELSYFNADLQHFKRSDLAQQNITQPGVRGYNNAILAMANVYYDFNGFVAGIQPFIGGGLGYAFINGQFISSTPTRYQKYNASNNVLAYQGTAGLTYNFAENYALNLAYKYVGTDTANDFGKIFQAHVANVGIIYRFNEPLYK